MALCLMPLCASAQWYLFPGKKKAETQQATSVEAKDTTRTLIVPEEFPVESDTAVSPFETAYFLDMPSVINITIALPLASNSSKPSENFLEMYSGALMGIKDLAASGRKMALKVIDTTEGNGLTAADIEDSDVLLGPVSYNDIVKTLPLLSPGKVLISPLDPKARELVDSMSVVQTPSYWTDQINAMVSWLDTDLARYKDEVIVLKDSTGTGLGEQGRYLIDKLKGYGIKYTEMNSLAAGSLDRFHKYRILIASDRDSYIASSVRSISAATANGENDITLYGTSKTRSASGVNVIDLHNSKAVLAMSYFIDYDSPEVKDFILAYRALFNSDPGSFAFQGYDAVKYYVNACAKYGRQWYKMLPEYSSNGLQASFEFNENGEKAGGRKNSGIRKVVYNKDLSSSLQ